MRPGDFSPGNAAHSRRLRMVYRRFNEAGGFLPRKHALLHAVSGASGVASMRPGDFSPGNTQEGENETNKTVSASMRPGDFSPGNSAGGGDETHAAGGGASMRPGDFSPGNFVSHREGGSLRIRFNEAGGFLPRKLRCDGSSKASFSRLLQ